MKKHEVIRLFAEVIDAIPMDNADIKELAERAGVSPTTLRNWKWGPTCDPRINTLFKVVTAMGGTITVKLNRSTLRLVDAALAAGEK